MAKTTLGASGGADVAVTTNAAAAGDAAPQSLLEKALAAKAAGHDALLKKNYDVAVEKTSNALQMIVKELGELVPETAPFYLEYGNALLVQVAARGDVIGGAIKQAEKDAKEKAEREEQEEQGEPETEEAPEAEDGNEEEVSAEAETTEAEAETAEAEAETAEAEAEEEEEAGDEDEEEAAQDEEGAEAAEPQKEAPADASADLEIVWEVLETARVIYSRQDDVNGRTGLADTLHRLGDFRLENDDISGAIEDYTKCLELREKDLAKDDRRLAAVHHALAIALINDKNCEQALDHFLSAKNVFARRVAKLLGKEISEKSSEDTGSEWKQLYETVTEETLTKIADEDAKSGKKTSADLKEYVEILRELDDKIVDVEENIKEMAATPETHSMEAISTMVQSVMAEAAAAVGLGGGDAFESAEAESSKDEVKNLGTIVGQKRKQQEEQSETVEEEPAKKLQKEE